MKFVEMHCKHIDLHTIVSKNLVGNIVPFDNYVKVLSIVALLPRVSNLIIDEYLEHLICHSSVIFSSK